MSVRSALRLLGASVSVISVAAIVAAPAHADIVDNSFLSALNNAGVAYDDPSSAVALGQSICPMLVQPGGSLASVASTVAGNGMPPEMAGLFTSIAISMFCPSVVASLANGNLPNLPDLPFPLRLPSA